MSAWYVLAFAWLALLSEASVDVSTRNEIHDWYTLYADAVDGRKWGRPFLDLFTEDAVLDYRASGGPVGVLDDMHAWLKHTLAHFDRSQHFISNVLIEQVDETTITSRAMFYNPMNLRYFPYKPLFTCGGWYNHTFTKMAGGQWKSKSLQQEMAYNNVVPNMLFWLACTGVASYTIAMHAWAWKQKRD
jgi:3-phenylpropionate/cinnamic acid dioxygenase small subunit